MSSTSTINGVVYHLINQLTDVADQQSDSMDNKEESDEPFSPGQVPTSNPEDFESTVDHRSEQDVSMPLAGHRKRTTITPCQRAILEEFYIGGMTSSGMQATQLHQSAAQKTGLSVRTIQVLSLIRVLLCQAQKICFSKTKLFTEKILFMIQISRRSVYFTLPLYIVLPAYYNYKA